MKALKLNRRQFLREAAAGAAGGLAGPPLLSRQNRGDAITADVLIIGAGMAGVAAGSTLRAHGITPILLEGNSERIGGRINTSFAWPDAPVDLGASWITHESINPLARLAQDSGIVIAPSNLLNFTLSEANGRLLPEPEVDRLLLLYGSVYAQVKLIAEQRIARRLSDLPASDAFARVLKQARLSPAVLHNLAWFLNYGIKEPNCAPLRDLSLKNWDDDLIFVQLYMGVFPKGYVQLVHRLAVGLDIRMGQVVDQIAYGPGGVTVFTNQGTFTAPSAIVTLPHAVLKHGTVEFTPPLPAWKQAAIRRLGNGLSNKTYVRFPHVFWDPEPDTLGRIAETSESRWSTWINFYPKVGLPILMAFNHGDYALELEDMSDTEVMDAAMQVLRKWYGPSIPDPLGIQRSKWASNPFSQGTIAHVPPGASSADYTTLGLPVGPLGFAGDSTTADFPTLVIAAYLTGVREANRILAQRGLSSPDSSIAVAGDPSAPGGPSEVVRLNTSSSGSSISWPGEGSPTATGTAAGEHRAKQQVQELIIRRRRRRSGAGPLLEAKQGSATTSPEVRAAQGRPKPHATSDRPSASAGRTTPDSSAPSNAESPRESAPPRGSGRTSGATPHEAGSHPGKKKG